ncbi:hypothetical protein ACMGD3_24375 [Lysinibacillus sphaericus]|uniref:hypothetical protein n=1 Tax=Lysinibacillus sphaericus TaxID=1421 RepID=UPI003F7AA21D
MGKETILLQTENEIMYIAEALIHQVDVYKKDAKKDAGLDGLSSAINMYCNAYYLVCDYFSFIYQCGYNPISLFYDYLKKYKVPVAVQGNLACKKDSFEKDVLVWHVPNERFYHAALLLLENQ